MRPGTGSTTFSGLCRWSDFGLPKAADPWKSGRRGILEGVLMLSDLANDAWRALGDILSPHGPAVQAAKTYAPSDFSIHFFLQLAIIILACRVVGWLGQKFLGQPQVV